MHVERLLLTVVGAALVSTGMAHGDHGGGAGQKPVVSKDADWPTKHMAEEHHVTDFDANSFFMLHDFDNDGKWSPKEIARLYGLMDESNAHLPPGRFDEVVTRVLAFYDTNHDGVIDRDEYVHGVKAGHILPDLGTGPGHHGDDEYEYEIHHWEKYHDENTKLEDLTHPEDIEHFRKHEELELEQERLDAMAKQSLTLENVPAKFRRQ